MRRPARKSATGYHKSLKFERVENRAMLAGDVAVDSSSGDLVIDGDDRGNKIFVRQIDDDTWEVRGIATTVNGSRSAQRFDDVFGNVVATLFEGNDLIKVYNGTVPGDLIVDTGDGADIVQVINVDAINLFLDTGSSRDVALLSSVRIDTDVGVLTGTGNDVFKAVKVSVGGIFGVATDEGHDLVALNTVSADTLSVSLEGSEFDSLVIVKGRANISTFDGGGQRGDKLVRAKSSLGDQTVDGFDIVV